MYFQNGNVKLYYEIMGTAGRPLLMLHGNGENHRIFYAAAEILSKDYCVILPDTRGHGQSDQPQNNCYHYVDMADDVLALCRHLNLQSPLIYGFSDGGITALLLALKSPQLPAAIAVSGANLNPRGLKSFFSLGMKISYALKKDPKTALMLREPQIDPDRLKTICCPALVTAGSRDLIKEKHTKRIAVAMPQATLKILKGESHGSYIVNNRKIAFLLRDFFKKYGL